MLRTKPNIFSVPPSEYLQLLLPLVEIQGPRSLFCHFITISPILTSGQYIGLSVNIRWLRIDIVAS